MNLAILRSLAKKGLVANTDVQIFTTALKSLRNGRRLSIKQGQILAHVLSILLDAVSEDIIMRRATTKYLKNEER
jgi:hypothetical protein